MSSYDPGNYFPPPTQMRDKHWSAQLRRMWPGYTRIKLPDSNLKQHPQKFRWCKEQAGRFYVCGASRCWYFEDPETAMLFKLTWGGM